MRPSRTRASASGVDREPGQTTASVTPARTHSSTRVAQNVAAVVITMPSYPAPRDAPCGSFGNRATRRPGARLHPEPSMLGLAARRPSPDATRSSRSTHPVTACRRTCGPTSGRPRPTSRSSTTMPPSWATRWAARMVLHTAITHPERVDRLVLVSGTAGIDDPTERARPPRRATTSSRRPSSATASMRSSTRWLDQPLFATLPPDARDRRRPP